MPSEIDAEIAGLGVLGKGTLKRYGSRLFVTKPCEYTNLYKERILGKNILTVAHGDEFGVVKITTKEV